MTDPGPGPAAGRPLVIGVGNRYAGDDGVGPVVADRVRALDPPRGAEPLVYFGSRYRRLEAPDT